VKLYILVYFQTVCLTLPCRLFSMVSKF